jgi:hypothetical protein
MEILSCPFKKHIFKTIKENLSMNIPKVFVSSVLAVLTFSAPQTIYGMEEQQKDPLTITGDLSAKQNELLKEHKNSKEEIVQQSINNDDTIDKVLGTDIIAARDQEPIDERQKNWLEMRSLNQEAEELKSILAALRAQVAGQDDLLPPYDKKLQLFERIQTKLEQYLQRVEAWRADEAEKLRAKESQEEEFKKRENEHRQKLEREAAEAWEAEDAEKLRAKESQEEEFKKREDEYRQQLEQETAKAQRVTEAERQRVRRYQAETQNDQLVPRTATAVAAGAGAALTAAIAFARYSSNSVFLDVANSLRQ